jgi:hypothetical protein
MMFPKNLRHVNPNLRMVSYNEGSLAVGDGNTVKPNITQLWGPSIEMYVILSPFINIRYFSFVKQMYINIF